MQTAAVTDKSNISRAAERSVEGGPEQDSAEGTGEAEKDYSIEIIVPARHVKRMGLLPMRSEKWFY